METRGSNGNAGFHLGRKRLPRSSEYRPRRMARLAEVVAGAAALSTLLSVSIPAAQSAGAYVVAAAETCDGWPRAPIETIPGICAGIVIAPQPGQFARRELRLPRSILPLSSSSFVIVDLGAWTGSNGAVWRLTLSPGRPPQLDRLLSGLQLPHGLGRGPDGHVYVGEMNRVFRFDPDAAKPQQTIEAVVTDLPGNRLHENRHPLSSFIFDGNGDLLINVGAPSDRCLDAEGQPKRTATGRCAETDGAEAPAAIRRYEYLGNGQWSSEFQTAARGLRNSLALARHSSGTIVQAENSIDYSDAARPFEELNVIGTGAHYGWPYCFDLDRTALDWTGASPMACTGSAHARPHTLLPPHSAPLGMLYYNGVMFPDLQGNLLIALHGYRQAGARLAAMEVAPDGLPPVKKGTRYSVYANGRIETRPYPAPAAEIRVLTPRWDVVRGRRPMGTPVGLAVADDGAIWVVEDKNATVLRFAVEKVK